MEIKHLKEMVFLLNNQNNKVKKLESELRTEKESLERFKKKILDIFEENGMDTFEIDDCKVYTDTRLNVRVEDKEKFFEYLKGQGIFNELASVNSQTLNAFYRESLDAAIAAGASDLIIPGLGESSSFTSIRIKKK